MSLFFRKRRVLVFGDSHVEALQQALQERGATRRGITIEAFYRKVPAMNGGFRGDTTLDEFKERAQELGPKDMVVSMLRGNVHHMVGMVQHPEPYDFLLPGDDTSPEDGKTLIPYKVLEDFFLRRLGKDTEPVHFFRRRTDACVCHLMAPPPKEGTKHIMQGPQVFLLMHIKELGVSPAPLRQKFWQLQKRVMEQIFADYEVPLIPVPKECLSERGFLREEYSAPDATHANKEYGKLLIKQIEKLVRAQTGKKTSKAMGRRKKLTPKQKGTEAA